MFEQGNQFNLLAKARNKERWITLDNINRLWAQDHRRQYQKQEMAESRTERREKGLVSSTTQSPSSSRQMDKQPKKPLPPRNVLEEDEDDEEEEDDQDPNRIVPNATTVMMYERRSLMVGLFKGDPAEFTPWKWRLEHHLTKLKLHHTIERTPREEPYGLPDPCATEEEEKERQKKYQKRCEEDCDAIEEIVTTISNGPLQKIMHCQYAKQAMDALCKAYQRCGTLVAMHIRRQLFTLNEKQFENLSELFNTHSGLCRDLELADPQVTHLEKVQTLLGAVPDAYKYVVAAILILPPEVLRKKPLDELHRMLYDAELIQKPSTSRNDVAMVAGRPTEPKYKNVQCFGCHRFGHYRDKCPLEKKKKQDRKKGVQRAIQQRRAEHAMMMQERSGLSTTCKRLPCVLDSGASNHMFNEERIMKKMKILEQEIQVATAKEGHLLQAKAKGEVSLMSVIGVNKMKKLKFYNVLFIPGLQENLISVKRVVSLGNEVVFSSGGVIIRDKFGEVIARGSCIDGLYFLDVFYEDDNEEENALLCKNDNSMLWHKRFGHIGFSNLEKLCKEKMVNGMAMQLKDFDQKKPFCDSCLFGKQTRDSFKNMELPRSKRPLALVHSDVCGYFEECTFDGYRYYVTFIDDYTHFTVIYLLRHKNEVLKCFKQYEAMASAHFDKKISCLRTDNGTEYYNTEFIDFCNENGINMVSTVPYTPQQNGVSERMNRTIMDKARTMLHEANLSKEFWGEAVYVAAYLTNRSPTNALLDNSTPFEKWFGQKPDVSKLRIFGCTAYAHVPKEKRKKLDVRSQPFLFIGYSNNGYRLWNASERKVEISRDVVFNEEKMIESDGNNHLDTDDQSVDDLLDSDIICASTSNQSSAFRDTSNAVLPDVPEENESFITAEDNDSLDESVVHDEIQQEERRSTRIRKQPGWLSDYETAFCATNFFDDIPQSVDMLKCRSDWKEWKTSINEELQSLNDNQTWTVVNQLPEGKKAIGSKWVFTIKSDNRYKARLVAKGCSQRPGFDYHETFAPVAKMSSIRVMLAFANQYKLYVDQMDVKTAFLYGHLQEEVYMHLPNDEFGQSKIVKLTKSLYGLKQAGRAWNQRFDEIMHKLGFDALKIDCCVYKAKNRQLCICYYLC